MTTVPAVPPDVQAIIALAADAANDLRGRQPAPWLDRLAAAHDAIDAALRWCIAAGLGDTGIDIAGPLWPYWQQRGHVPLGRERLAAVLALPAAGTRNRARALCGAGTLAWFQADLDAAGRYLRESLSLAESLNFAEGIADAHSGLSRIAMSRGEPESMRAHSRAALAAAQPAGYEAGIAIAAHHVAHAALMDGDLAQAAALYAGNIDTYRAMGRQELVVSELHNLGHVACLQERFDYARARFAEGLRLGAQIGDTATRPYSLIGLGRVAAARGRWVPAAAWLGAGLAILQAQGKSPAPLLRPAIDEALSTVRAALPPARFARASQVGVRRAASLGR